MSNFKGVSNFHENYRLQGKGKGEGMRVEILAPTNSDVIRDEAVIAMPIRISVRLFEGPKLVDHASVYVEILHGKIRILS